MGKKGYTTYNEDKDNNNITEGTVKVPETTNKKQRYRRRYDKNHQIYRATDFVGDTPEVYVILYLLLEKLEK